MSWQPYWVEYRHVVQYSEPVSTNLTDIYICTYVHVCMYVRMYICMYVRMYVLVCVVILICIISSVLCLAAEES